MGRVIDFENDFFCGLVFVFVNGGEVYFVLEIVWYGIWGVLFDNNGGNVVYGGWFGDDIGWGWRGCWNGIYIG